ncbi:hypothetical protein SKAU_G00332910 [Synaphobranchus kaupii]|uniref:Uncharacterized protein n=1 Tax=Synaphobranchus kaupii TaxID=118154 RepID=A0A9Q1ELG0_SYNKA|nr:hypothetical protein SKAU_G00332910 [Synaphobranchus kaupii]
MELHQAAGSVEATRLFSLSPLSFGCLMLEHLRPMQEREKDVACRGVLTGERIRADAWSSDWGNPRSPTTMADTDGEEPRALTCQRYAVCREPGSDPPAPASQPGDRSSEDNGERATSALGYSTFPSILFLVK